MARKLTLLVARMSRPPPKAMANPVLENESEKLTPAPEVCSLMFPCATPKRACAKGVRRVLLRALISGPARKLYSRDFTVTFCVIEEQGGVAQGCVNKPGPSSVSK